MSEEAKITDKKVGQPRFRPDEIKLQVGLRMFPSDREKLEQRFFNDKGEGSIQSFFDKKIAEELRLIEEEESLKCNSQD